MKGLLSLTNSWTLWFSRELTSSREFQHSTLIVVGGIVAQYPPWIGFVSRHSRNFKLTLFFSSENNYYIFAIPHSSYTLSRGLKIQFYYFTILLKKVCTVRIYVIQLLGTYVTIWCNWLILWQNALYLYLGRSRMCLILQETCCSSLVLKQWRLDQKTSEEKLFTKVGQIAQHLRTNSYLSRFNEAWQILSIEVTGIQIFRSDFLPMLTCMCRVSFLTTLDIYKAYFRGRHIREY